MLRRGKLSNGAMPICFHAINSRENLRESLRENIWLGPREFFIMFSPTDGMHEEDGCDAFDAASALDARSKEKLSNLLGVAKYSVVSVCVWAVDCCCRG